MLQTQGLKFAYNSNLSFSFPDMECKEGSHWLILGQSGCGKTTLLHILGGMRKPTSGLISINGMEINKMDEATLDNFRGGHIGVIFQQPHLINAITVEENLLAAQYLAQKKQDKKRVRELLEKLNLSAKLKVRPKRLSQGEQQRVSIARALINNPVLVLADEPTSSLDDDNCKEVVDLLLEQSKEHNATLIIVTHDNRLKSLFENQIELTPSKQEY
ncbi:MAG: ABC transporter ATP-binding protein [Saprospiraceae bacterium]|nr:ABC transporter ATP-binding protein [Saprospiraceae bacterium]